MSFKTQLNQVLNNKLALSIVLGGVLAFATVGVMAYQIFFGSGAGAEISQEDMRVLQNTPSQAENITAPPSEDQKIKKELKRQKSISENQITGSWIVPLKDGQGLVQLSGGTYRLIIVPSTGSRWYSNGRYTLKDDLLMLKPNLEWGAPQSNKFNYLLLTRGNIPVMVSLYEGRMVWQSPSADMDIYVPPSHPFLTLTREGIAVWRVLK